MEKFIGLQIVLVVLVGKIASIDQLWGKEWDHPAQSLEITIISVAQSLKIDTRELMKRLRFDNFSTRRKRKQIHKFCLISDTCNNFVKNYKKCFLPRFDLIIDEQLFPFKRLCSLYSTCQISPIKSV